MISGVTLIVVLVLVAVNAAFVAAEFAIVTVRRSRVEALVRAGSRRGKILSIIVSDLDAHISAIQLAITTVGIAIGWLGEPAIAANLERFFTLAGISNEFFVRWTRSLWLFSRSR